MADIKEKQEELDLQLEDEGQDVEVTLEDKTETDDAQVDLVAEDQQAEDEFKKAENQTTKRINRLTKKMREAEKNAEEALRFAKQKEQENQQLAQKLTQMDTNYVDQYSGRVESQMAQTEQNLRAAMEVGDTEAAVAAQKEMTRLAVEADRAAQAKAANEERNKAAQARTAPQSDERAYRQGVQPPPEPDAKAQAWAQKNEWFGNDSAMTYAAFGIHKDLVEQEGIDPKSDEYYTELDKRMGEEFPHKFANGAQSKKVVQNVASASRSTGTGRSSGKRQVRLTNRQVALAKKLGVPLEEYAKYVKE